MRVPRIFTQQALAPGPLTLEPEPSRHIARALRLREDASLILFDGNGGEYSATITRVDKKTVDVVVGDYSDASLESPLTIHLGIAVSRGERFDWVVQKATELGVASIVPLWTARTGVKLTPDRIAKKQTHWQQIAISACEQCGRNRVPRIAEPLNYGAWLAQCQGDVGVVLHTAAHGNARLDDVHAPATVDLLVGPEGGFTGEEVDAAIAAGFKTLQLGPRVLRTETAPVAALTALQARWGDLQFS